MRPIPRSSFVAVLLAVALAVPAFSQEMPPPSRPPALDAAHRAVILDSLVAQLQRYYVEPDTARMIVNRLRARQAAHAYDGDVSPGEFSEHVTDDLRAINGDRHLSLRYDPNHTGPLSGAMPVIRRVLGGPGGGAGAPREGGPVIVRSVAAPGAPGDSAGAGPGMPGARERNFGLNRVEILPGNIGYLEVTGFLEAPGMEDAMVAALRFLERTDALIIDVRRNGGGSGRMSDLLLSHFLGATPVPLVRVKSRIEGMSREQMSEAEVPGPRRPDVPLEVLTSRFTGSAAEAFSFVLKNLGRATLFGERTAGAGHMVQGFGLPDGFVAGVSITRVSDPRTGREWEAVGVAPDVEVPAQRALVAAHAALLRRQAAAAPAPRRTTLEWLAQWVEVRDLPRAIDPSLVTRASGTYEGDRSVRFEDGKLVYRRGARTEDLVPLPDGSFSLAGEAKLTFAPGNPAPSMSVETADGAGVRTIPRVARSD